MNIFKRIFERKASRTWSGVIQAGLPQAVWTSKDYSKLSKAGYENCMTVYSCVRLIATTAAGIEWKLVQLPRSRGGKIEEMDESHPLLWRLHHPNDQKRMSKRKLIESASGFLLLAGNNYIKGSGPLTGENKGKIMALGLLFPDRTKVLPGNKLAPVGGYEYSYGAGKPDVYGPDEVLHTKLFHPNDEVYGLSPISVASKGVDILNMSLEWNMRLLQNDCKPPMAINAKAGFESKEDKELFEKAILESYAGYKNAGKPIITEGEVTWEQLSMSPHDMDWLNADKTTAQKVCSIFNVAPELIGFTEKKYSNYPEARKALYIEAVLPLMYIFRDDFNIWLTPRYGERLELRLNLDKIDALKEDRKTVFEYVSKVDCITDNEKREILGYDNIGPAGDVIYKPINLVPIGSDATASRSIKSVPLIYQREIKADTKSFWAAPERKRLLWDSFVLRIEAKEKPVVPLAEDFLEGQVKKIVSAAGKLKTLQGSLAEGLHDKEAESDRYLKKMLPWYTDAAQSAGNAGMVTSKGQLYTLEQKDDDILGGIFSLTPELEKLLHKIITHSGTKINEFTMSLIEDMLKIAIADSWTVEEFTQEIGIKLRSFINHRARRIARTETAKVENWGQHQGYEQSEFVNARGWLSAFTDDTRQTHMDADAQYSNNPLSLDQPFVVGGEELMYPGDYRGSAGNVINCLCSTFPHVSIGAGA